MERWRFSSVVFTSLALSTVIYPLVARWVWGGGWMAQLGVSAGLGHGVVDFAGSAPQVEGSLNANYAITLSAVFYVFTALARDPIPANEGLLERIRVVAPSGSSTQTCVFTCPETQ